MSDQPNATPAGWYPDPFGRYDHRWYNGAAWTADVSVDGGRFVDPLPLDVPRGPAVQFTPPAGVRGGSPYGGPTAVPHRPSRALAVLALIAGLVSITTGWMPIFFVIGAIAGVAAITLGAIARRRVAEGRAAGGGMALAGLVLGPIGLATCVIGVLLTGVLLRAVREYTEPGPVDVEVLSCEPDGRAVRITGTIENLDDEMHDYSLVVEIVDGRDVIDRDDVAIDDVAAGQQRSWERLVLTRGNTPDDPECEIFAVNGPFPFGLDPNP